MQLVTSPQSSAPGVSVSVMSSYNGTLMSDYKQSSPLKSKISSVLPNRPKGPVRASSTSSLDRIGDASGDNQEMVKTAFIDGAGWASQVRDF